MQSELWNKNNDIGFSNCIPSVTNTPYNARYSVWPINSRLSIIALSLYITLHNQIKSNIVAIENLNTDHEYQTLQLRFIHEKHDIIPENWLLNLSKKKLRRQD